MNEKVLIKFFGVVIGLVFAVVLAISLSVQSLAEDRVEDVLGEFLDGYGVMLSRLFANDALNGNSRAVVEGLERLETSSTIDGFLFKSFVSDFEHESKNFDSERYFESIVDINYSGSDRVAAQIVVYFERTRLVEHKKRIALTNQIGWVLLLFVLIFGSLIGFTVLKKENRFIRNFIRDTFTVSPDSGLQSASAIWSPIVEAVRHAKDRVDALTRDLEKARTSEAIARTTQMLAHDVRKPFNLFRMTLDRVNSAGTPEQVKQALHEALPEVERSLANVNGLISDVLNVGGEFHLVLKPVRLAPLVEDVVDELRKLYPTRSLNVQIKVPSDLWVLADDTRLPRVFLNLLSNAVEAVALNEVQLWISTGSPAAPAEKKQVEIRVGNAGSFIPEETRVQLFDLFFTSGKKGGTGLGLAIVKKIIEGHGSTVKCESERTEAHPNGQVEFVWSLQSAQALASREAAEPMTLQTSPSSASRTAPSGDGTAPCDPVLKTQQAPSPPRPLVAFVDDSPLVRWAWETKLKSDVTVRAFTGPREFWQAVNEKSIELSQLHTIITDHYFAPEESLTGLEFAKELREAGFAGRVLLASSGEFKPEAVAGLVDKIVDKQPVSWSELGASP